MPEGGWTSANDLVGLGVFGTLFSLMFSVMIYQVIILRRQRHKLRYMALTDALTRVYNRNGMDEQVDIYIRKYPNEPCVSVMMDIDDFKNINDTYGHHYGDKVLKDFAKDMKDTFNVNSIIGRNGGDEFCMILKNCTLKTASDLIKRFSEHKRRFTVEGKSTLTASQLALQKHQLKTSIDRAYSRKLILPFMMLKLMVSAVVRNIRKNLNKV